MELTELKAEQKRTYVWADGFTLSIEDVTHFKASTTTHRLKTGDGLLHIVPEGWRHIIIEAAEFTL